MYFLAEMLSAKAYIGCSIKRLCATQYYHYATDIDTWKWEWMNPKNGCLIVEGIHIMEMMSGNGI